MSTREISTTSESDTVAVDFDGVIHKYSKRYHDGTIYDEPIEGAFKALELLSKKFNVIIYTTRAAVPIKNWFKKHGQECPQVYYKPRARYYIDDRAVKFTDWEDVLKKIL